MSKNKIVILGAGLAGLSAAWHLQRNNIENELFEKDSEAGGLCRSREVNGFTFDCDGHLLHFRHRYAFDLVSELLGGNLTEHERSSWIWSHGKFTHYPFQANLYGLPTGIVKECLSGFIRARNSGQPAENGNFLHWINSAFGEGIARHFMIPYNTKFWTVSPEKLTCEWLKGFIPRPTLNEVIEGTIEDSPRQFGYNAHFWYPKKGPIQELPLAFRKRLKNVHTGCEASRIDLKKKILVFSNGSECRYDILISTIPLPELAVLIKDMPLSVLNAFKKLRWNSVFNLNLGLRQKVRCDKHWIYFPQRDLSFFRVGFYHNFSSNLSAAADSSIYAEVSYSKEKPVDKKILPSRIRKDLISTGIISSSDRVKAQDINDIKYAYPIYDRDYSRARKRVLDFLSRNRMIPCGRFGSWRYMSMEDVIMDGKGVAAKAQEMCG